MDLKKTFMKTLKIKSKGLPELKLTATLHKPEFYEPKFVRNSQDAYSALVGEYDPYTFNYLEESLMLALNRRNEIIGIYRLSRGGCTGTVIDTRVVFATLLLAGACAFVLSHNHPSGNSQPSDADIAVTKRLKQVGALMEIVLIDHIIVTATGYYSMGDEGVMG
jgi:DNA repair protein RadC